MFYKNARIFTPEDGFQNGAFQVIDGRFGQILPDKAPGTAEDLHGATVIPGLIEVHSHGCRGCDFSDGDYEGLVTMAKFYLSKGITSFAPSSMTLDYDTLRTAFTAAQKLSREQPEGCSVLRGIHMEGPYLSEKKKGAQNAAYLKKPDFPGFQKLYEGCGGLIRIVDVAPELEGAEEFIRQASPLCTVSIAHTDSDYDHAAAAVRAGATHLTHLYNAMPGIHHRSPGVIPAAAESDNVLAEIICDGFHVHPAAVRLAFRMFPNRMVLVSDSGRCAGMPQGTRFTLGGQYAVLKNGVGRLEDGTIVCSASNLYSCMVNCLSWGIPEEEVIRAAAWNPACALGVQDQVGAIKEGLRADFLVCTQGYEKIRVFLAGKEMA